MLVFNETHNLIILYHFLLFTDFVPDKMMKYQMGFSLIANIIIQVLANMAVIVAHFIHDCRAGMLRRRARKRYEKNMRAIKDQLEKLNSSENVMRLKALAAEETIKHHKLDPESKVFTINGRPVLFHVDRDGVKCNRIKDKVILDLKLRDMVKKEEKEYDEKHNFKLLSESTRGT
jgi:hypothetical protein